MFLTTTRLFLIVSGYLADNYSKARYIPAPEMAMRYRINVRALMPSLVRLTRAGILSSRVGGKEPGFMFSRDPKDINMLEILRELEGDPCFTCCKDVLSTVQHDCSDDNRCQLYILMNEAIDDIKEKMGNITLKEYCETRQPTHTQI